MCMIYIDNNQTLLSSVDNIITTFMHSTKRVPSVVCYFVYMHKIDTGKYVYLQ